MNPVFEISQGHFVIVSFLLVAAGIATVLTKRNAIGILIGVELILNAAAVNFVAFNRYSWGAGTGEPRIDGWIFAMFVIVLAAAEAAIALAIFLNFYNNFGSIDVEKADELKRLSLAPEARPPVSPRPGPPTPDRQRTRLR